MKNNKVIKKVITLGLALAMVLSMASVASAASGIGKDKAISIALKDANTTKSAVRALDCEYESDEGAYDIEFRKGSTSYEYAVRAKTGFIKEKSVEYKYQKANGPKIGKNAAISKALKYVGTTKSKVNKLRCYYDYDDGKSLYIVKFRKGNFKFDCEVNARSGKMVEYSREYHKTR